MVGEESNKLVGYLAAVSRHLESPLAVVVQSSSAAGKSSLMDAVLAFVPEEERIQYSAMTGPVALLHGRDGSEAQGAGHRRGRRREPRAAYALKLLQSEGVLSIASTGKDPGHGKTGHASVPRGRPGDDLPDHHGHRSRRRAAQPLPGAHGERGPRADAGDPPLAARAADARRPAAPPGAQGDRPPASERAAAAEAAVRRQSLRATS